MKVPLMRWNDFKYDKLIFPQWADVIVSQWHEHNFEERVKKLAPILYLIYLKRIIVFLQMTIHLKTSFHNIGT